jgi:nitric oxide reductase NorD protein
MAAASGADRKRRLADALSDRPELAGTMELVWRQAQSSFPGGKLDDWLAACRDLAASGTGSALAYIRNAPACALGAGPDAALGLAHAARSLASLAGEHAALALLTAAPKAARILGKGLGFPEWLRVVGLVAERAPESVALMLDRVESVLAERDVRAFEAWALGAIRAAENDPERRLKFFALLDPRAQRSLAHTAGEVTFADVERQLKAFVMALWRMAPPLRATSAGSAERARRSSVVGGLVRMPEAFVGFVGRSAKDLYFAALAHVCAHLRFSNVRFPVGKLKPVQVALVSLIEDARVEQLAMATHPGLRRLWLPYHVGLAAGATTAPALMARLSRALIDPAYVDDNGWVQKGKDLFFGDRRGWTDPAISRSIGSLLGNDLGQMRVQFNARTYVVEPPYRDDNQGLWDFPHTGSASPEAETIFESVRFDQAAGETESPDRQRGARDDETPDGANRTALIEADAEIGIPVARYPEWDYLIGQDRAEWTTLLEYEPEDGRAAKVDQILERNPQLVYRIEKLIHSAKVSRPVRLRRQPEGDRLDLEACIDAARDRRLGQTPDPKVYARLDRRYRDLSVLLLLDVSQSTNDIVGSAGVSVLELEREAAALLAHAMDGLGDPFAIHAFCSDGRADVRYYRVKDFADPYGAAAKRRLAGLTARLSTRIGAPLRHAGRELASQMSYRKLLLVVTDGEPSDIDVADRRYLVEDARRAIMNLTHHGIDVFCVGLDAGGDSYLTRIFGRRNVLQIDRIEQLSEKLPMLYFKLTG